MAHTTAGRRATEEHRTAQVALATSVISLLRFMYLDLFRPADIDGSARKFITKALPAVLDARQVSHNLAQDYLDTFRSAELRGLSRYPSLQGDPVDPFTVDSQLLDMWADMELSTPDALDSLPEPGEVARALYVSSAGVAKKHIGKGSSVDFARDRGAAAVAAKGQKLVADGGRAPLAAEVSAGRFGAVGYARVVDADPCPFCAMLASRGAVYRSNAFETTNDLFTGDGRFKVHDGCGCTMEPIYGRRLSNLPPESARLAKEWAEVASGQPDPFNAWRRWRVSGTKPGEEQANASTEARPSAPQYGRARKRASGADKPRRKAITELNREELSQTLPGMYARRDGMKKHLEELLASGQSVTEPGPAAQVARKLEQVNSQIETAQRRLGKLIV